MQPAESGAAAVAKREDIAGAVRSAGVRPGDVLLVHSSLRSLGRVDGGPESVIDALIDAVGPDGLLVMPTFTLSRLTVEQVQPPEAYSPTQTSCRQRTGIIPDTFWRLPGVARSGHPTHSLAALGPRAAEFADGGLTRTFDPAGPFGRYARWGGRALFLGVRLGSNTTFHCAEDWMGLPFLTRETALVLTDTGTVAVPVTGSPSGCRGYYGCGGPPARALEDAGVLSHARLSAAEITLVDARDVVRVCCQQELASCGALLCPGTPHEFCKAALAASVEARPSTRERIERLRASNWAPTADWS